ncbi:MAG: hypothetical protein CMM07_16950 [Rhodopirellula sp.]|nr:hypothetical protein [Rhodopirellula sp.]
MTRTTSKRGQIRTIQRLVIHHKTILLAVFDPLGTSSLHDNTDPIDTAEPQLGFQSHHRWAARTLLATSQLHFTQSTQLNSLATTSASCKLPFDQATSTNSQDEPAEQLPYT